MLAKCQENFKVIAFIKKKKREREWERERENKKKKYCLRKGPILNVFTFSSWCINLWSALTLQTLYLFICLWDLGCFLCFWKLHGKVFIFLFLKNCLSFYIQGRHTLFCVHLMLFLVEISEMLKYFFHGSVLSFLFLWPKSHFSFKCSLLSGSSVNRVSMTGQTKKVKIEKKILVNSSLLENAFIPHFESSSIFFIFLCKLCVLEELEFQKIAKSISSIDSKYWTFLPEKDKTYWNLPYF